MRASDKKEVVVIAKTYRKTNKQKNVRNIAVDKTNSRSPRISNKGYISWAYESVFVSYSQQVNYP